MDAPLVRVNKSRSAPESAKAAARFTFPFPQCHRLMLESFRSKSNVHGGELEHYGVPFFIMSLTKELIGLVSGDALG